MLEEGKYFIHLEGLDLAGKSSLAHYIKDNSKYSWKINNNQLTSKNIIYEFTNQLGKEEMYDDEIYGYLYSIALMADIKKFNQTENIIQDSTLLLRSLNYHTNCGNSKIVNILLDLIEKHPKPDASIYLTANIETRIKRLQKVMKDNPNGVSKNDMLILNDPNEFITRDKKLQLLSQKYFGSVIIDTSYLTYEEIVEKISNIIGLDISGDTKKLCKK